MYSVNHSTLKKDPALCLIIDSWLLKAISSLLMQVDYKEAFQNL